MLITLLPLWAWVLTTILFLIILAFIHGVWVVGQLGLHQAEDHPVFLAFWDDPTFVWLYKFCGMVRVPLTWLGVLIYAWDALIRFGRLGQ